MYRIIKVSDGTEIGVTDSAEFIRYGNSGCLFPLMRIMPLGWLMMESPTILSGMTISRTQIQLLYQNLTAAVW